jgi:hypothetical protein
MRGLSRILHGGERETLVRGAYQAAARKEIGGILRAARY